jgi:hypothetical protein
MILTTTISLNCTLKSVADDNAFIILHTMDNLSHECILLLDTNLLVQIERGANTPWVTWFIRHTLMGKICFVTPVVAKEYGKTLPDGVRLLQSHHPRSDESFNTAVQGISPPHPNHTVSAN